MGSSPSTAAEAKSRTGASWARAAAGPRAGRTPRQRARRVRTAPAARRGWRDNGILRSMRTPFGVDGPDRNPACPSRRSRRMKWLARSGHSWVAALLPEESHMPVLAPIPSDLPVTALLHSWRGGHAEALEQLVPLVYDE